MIHPRRNAPFVLAVLVLGVAWASEPPDSDVNPLTGSIESVEVVEVDGVPHVRHSIDPGQGAPSVTTQLSGGASADRSPRIAIRSDGLPGVVWWRDGTSDVVVLRKRGSAIGQDWGAETQLNATGTSSREPAIVADGTTLWIAFETDAPGGRSIEVRGILDDPMPIITIEPLTGHTGDLDTLIHLDQGELWVTWIDSTSDVGWSELDRATDTWSLPVYESYAADSVEDARERIRDTVTSN